MCRSNKTKKRKNQFSVREFRDRNNLSKYLYYAIRSKHGRPLLYKIGDKNYISRQEERRYSKMAQAGKFENRKDDAQTSKAKATFK